MSKSIEEYLNEMEFLEDIHDGTIMVYEDTNGILWYYTEHLEGKPNVCKHLTKDLESITLTRDNAGQTIDTGDM